MPNTKPAPTALDIAIGQRTIAKEIDGLHALSSALDEHFVRAVETIAQLQGRLILTGMGKSGHIARKIAATLASTGTPASFVHPGEASHGDLGMITEKDAVIAFSNSGETQELRDIIAYTRRFSIPLIAVVRRQNSMMVQAADIPIILPDVAEASPVNAPTTSTTMMLAWGDALAMCLVERRGFTAEDFSVYHPGGKLGQALLQVEALMHVGDAVPLVPTDMKMDEVLLQMTAKTFGCAGVVDAQGTLLGVITDGDLRRHMKDDLMQRSAREVMTASPITITPQTLAAKALGMMNDRKITTLFVVDSIGKAVGILHIHDCLRAGVM